MSKNEAAKKRKKEKRKLMVAYTGVAIGLLLLLFPFIFSWYTSYKKGPALEDYEKQVANYSEKILKKAKAYNEEIFNQQKSSGGADGSKMIEDVIGKDLKKPLGYIDIPSIRLKNMVIYYGDSDWVLNRGVGNMDWTSLPSGGKSTMASLTGHSGLANQIYFDNIRHLRKGDVVFLNTFGQKLAYELTGERLVVNPDDPESVKKFFVRENEDMIVLMTCTPIFVNSDRLLVFAKRVPYEQAEFKKVIRRDTFSIDHIFIAIVLLILVLIGVYILYQNHRRKLKRKERKTR